MLTYVALVVVATSGTSSSFSDGSIYIAGVIGAIVTVAGTYLVKRRSTSGSVKTSDADTIFKEGDAIRKWLTDTLEKERSDRAEEREADQKTIRNLQERSLNDRSEIAKMERRINILEKMIRDSGLEVPES